MHKAINPIPSPMSSADSSAADSHEMYFESLLVNDQSDKLSTA